MQLVMKLYFTISNCLQCNQTLTETAIKDIAICTEILSNILHTIPTNILFLISNNETLTETAIGDIAICTAMLSNWIQYQPIVAV